MLAIGSVLLPPSPRLLVAQGRDDEALRTLAKLRLRSEHEAQDDPLLQVRAFGYHFLRTPSLSCPLVPGSYVIDVCFLFHIILPPFGLPPDPHQIEMLEMRVEARLVRQTQGLPSLSGPESGIGFQLGEGRDHPKSTSANITAEFKSWARLFSRKFIDRTWIGILMMVFQRECGNRISHPPLVQYSPSLRFPHGDRVPVALLV